MQSLKKLAWNDDHVSSESSLIRETAMHIILFHYLLASWPENILTLIDRVAKQTEGQQVGGRMLENVWQTDQLVQHIWSSSSYSDTPFAFLLQMFEAFFTWATISGFSSSGGEGQGHE